MNLKLSTFILCSALVGGAITAVCFTISQSRLPQQAVGVNAVSLDTVTNCRYMYDEIAHKLIAYSATEKCAADHRGFSLKVGSRIMELTKGSLAEPQIVTL